MRLPALDGTAVPPPYPVGTCRFQPGDAVRVRRGDAPGHLRTPWYVRGHAGRIERICGGFPNPEELAYHRAGGEIPLYRVRFTAVELWGEGAETPSDTIDVEIFEHWLEPADAA